MAITGIDQDLLRRVQEKYPAAFVSDEQATTLREKGLGGGVVEQEPEVTTSTPDKSRAAPVGAATDISKQSAQAYIQAREKRASQLMAQGVTSNPTQARLIAAQELRETNFAQPPQKTIEQKKAEAAGLTGDLAEAGAFEEVTPQEVSLTPSSKFGEGLPVIGPATAALQSVLGSAFLKGWLSAFKGKGAATAGSEFPITPETLREATLAEIRAEHFNEGISKGEAFGSLVESVPIAGSLVAKYASGLVETPSANADNVIAEIRSERERAATGAEKVRNGLMSPDYALSSARDMEENIAALEGRMKLLINSSPILRANADEVNKIQEEILRARERVAQFRQASVFALTAERTGTGRVVPTDEQLYFELKNYKE